VKIKDFDAKFIPEENVLRHHNMARKQSYDIAEFSGIGLFIARERGEPIIGLPIFPRRLFSYSFIYINSDAKIREPRDLIGKKVATPAYGITMAVLARGDLQHEYDVHPSKIRWIKTEEELYPFNQPKDIQLQQIPGNKDMLENMLIRGEIDAMIYPTIIRPFREGSPKVKRLFPDFASKEKEYARRKSFYPLMHCIMIRNRLAVKYKDRISNIVRAFEDSKRLCYDELSHPAYSSSIWSNYELEQQREVLGPDVFPTGIEANRLALQELMNLCVEQGFISREMEISTLFGVS
jgi:4,5-dihydroxyphthalate decarboxylase